MEKMKISVIGGDSRQVYAAEALRDDGLEVRLSGFDCFEAFSPSLAQISLEEALRADALLLPLPYTKNNKNIFAPFAQSPIALGEIFESLQSGQLVFIGNADQKTMAKIELHGARAYDYFKDEALTQYNARLTAEGLVGLVIHHLPVGLLNARIAVVGYGRIADHTAMLLQSCGAKLTVFARSPVQLAKAAAKGYITSGLPFRISENDRFDCVINTVPAQLLTKEALLPLNRDCLLIEAASAPYGIDFDAASVMGFTVCKAFSLPGKVSPKSAGAAIAKTIIGKIRR